MPGTPGPDGRHDDLEADELEGLALLVPDDARSLDPDREAYLAELRQRRDGPQRWSRRRPDSPPHGRPDPSARWRRVAFGSVGLAGPALLVLLVVLGLVGSTLSVFGSGPTAGVARPPLATAPPAPAGQVGGLLPDVIYTLKGTPQPLRTLRPAILVLVPGTCPACGAVLRSLVSQAQEYHLYLALVGRPAQEAQLLALDATELGGSVMIAVDTTDAVRGSYQPSGVTALLVQGDGIVAEVSRDVTASTRLETALAQLNPLSQATA